MCVDVSCHIGLVGAAMSRMGLHARPDQEDWWQEGCLALCLAARSYDASHGTSFSSWASRSIEGHYRDTRKAAAAAFRRAVTVGIPGKLADSAQSATPSPDALAELSESSQAVKEALSRLTGREEAIALMLLDGASAAAVGRTLGLCHGQAWRECRRVEALLASMLPEGLKEAPQ